MTRKTNVLFLAILSVFVLSVACSMPKQKQVNLKALADNTGDGLSIKNDTNFDWNNLVVTIDNAYSAAVLNAKAGQTFHVRYSDFKDKNGKPYPSKEPPSKFFLEADEGTGPV